MSIPSYKYLLPSLLPPTHQQALLQPLQSSGVSPAPHLPGCLFVWSLVGRHSTDDSDIDISKMSRGRSGGRGLDLKLNLNLNLNLSPPPPPRRGARAAASSDEESSPSSCLSSEGEREQGLGLQWSDSPEATSMVVAACPRCLMYVMLSETDPRCPRCLNPVLLDFHHHDAGVGNNRNSARGGGRRNRKA